MIEGEIEITIPSTEDFLKEIKDTEVKDIRTEFVGRVVIIVIAGLGLISVLAWDDALKNLYKSVVAESDSLFGKFGYALIITLISVVVSIILGRAFYNKEIKEVQK
jgi:hypothetical protein